MLPISPDQLKKTVSLQCANDVNNIISFLKTDLSINYYAYIRIYPDGTRFYLNNFHDWMASFFSKYFELGITSGSYESYKSELIVADVSSKNAICQIMRTDYNIANIFLIINKLAEHCEINLFGTMSDDHMSINRYLNNLGLLKKFTYFFKEKAEDLIISAENDRSILPKVEVIKSIPQEIANYCSSPINKSDLLNLKRFKVNYAGTSHYITAKEAACLNQLLQGKTAKEAAKLLNISYRTVESHLEHVRTRFGVNNRAEVFIRLIQSGLVSFESVF